MKLGPRTGGRDIRSQSWETEEEEKRRHWETAAAIAGVRTVWRGDLLVGPLAAIGGGAYPSW